MDKLTITEVSRDYGISTRMLRYYEQAGLIKSTRREGYAYRVYDADAVNRLRQIIVLRKLRVPVKQIVTILSDHDASETVEIFRKNIASLDEEITALSTVREILSRFIDELNERVSIDLNIGLLGDEAVFAAINALSFPNNKIQETKEAITMDNLNEASRVLEKLTDKDVRIVYVPPMTVASYTARGENCEGQAGDAVARFVTETGLLKIKPDARNFGFDCSEGEAQVGEPSRAYGMWVSIPDEMEVHAPFEKKHFGGGMYAAHVLRAWDFADLRLLNEWIETNNKYDALMGPFVDENGVITGQYFEETLNFNGYVNGGFKMEDMQLDLLFAIKEKN